MKMPENLKKMRENHVKTISLGEGLRYDQQVVLDGPASDPVPVLSRQIVPWPQGSVLRLILYH